MKNELINMTWAWDKGKIWVPKRHWTHDLLNTMRRSIHLVTRTCGEFIFAVHLYNYIEPHVLKAGLSRIRWNVHVALIEQVFCMLSFSFFEQVCTLVLGSGVSLVLFGFQICWWSYVKFLALLSKFTSCSAVSSVWLNSEVLWHTSMLKLFPQFA